MQRKENVQSTCNIREKQTIPELAGNKIYDVTTNVDITKQTVLNDRILYEGEVTLNYIFNSSNGVDTKKIVVPFNFNVDFPGVNQNSNIETNIEMGAQDFVITSDDSIDVKIDIIFNVTMAKSADINIIDDIKEEENRSACTCSLVIYYVKDGDTLWKIAKKFGSTVEEIARINGIENVDKLNVAQQLFIPRYHE